MYKKIIRALWLAFIAGSVFGISWFWAVSENLGGYFGGMPDLKELDNPKQSIASELYSADSVLIGKYFYENRTPVRFEELPENLINALIATEDERFYEHSGIDFYSMFRVVYGVATGDLKGGGSTVTQQLAKNLFNTREELTGTFQNVKPKFLGKLLSILNTKSKEWLLAIELEKSYTKNEILTLYFNTVDFGRNSFGIQVAAKRYFGVNVQDLSIQEAAVLVGMLKAPSRYNPIGDSKDLSFKRRNVVLDQMRKNHFINTDQYDSLKTLSLDVLENEQDIDDHNRGLATYFRKMARLELMKWCKENNKDLYSDGLKIYTTLDTRMQKYAEAAMLTHMKNIQEKFFDHWKGKNPWINESYKEIPNFIEHAAKNTDRYRALKKMYGDDSVKIFTELEKKIAMKVFTWENESYSKDTVLSPMDSIRYYKHFLHTGVVVIDPKTGHIKCWVGGINHQYFKYDHVGQGRRQPGSTFKPIVYATAINEKKMHPCDEVLDVPVTFVLADGKSWTVKNSYGNYTGNTFTLRQGMAMSVNTVAAFLIKEVTPEKVVQMARNMGINSPLEAVPSLSVGTSDVNVLELTGAYCTFVNEGKWTEPQFLVRIDDKNGNTLRTFLPKTKEVFDKKTAYTMIHMLKGAAEEQNGTALGLWKNEFRRGNEIGGKTGTTSNYSDGWFMGLTKDYVCGVWVGAEDRAVHFKSMEYGQGSRMAMPIFANFSDLLFKDEKLMQSINYSKGPFPKPPHIEGEDDLNFNCKEHHKVVQKLPQYEDPDDIM